jgi:transposase
MAAKRVDMHRLQEFVRLHRLGTSAREVCRLLRMGRTTEWHYRKAFQSAGVLHGPGDDLPAIEVLKSACRAVVTAAVAQREISSVEPWRDQVVTMVERGARARAIYDRLRIEDAAFACSESAVKRFCTRLRRERGITPEDVAIPVETGPGEVAQVDFGYVGKIYDPEAGVRRKAWVFVMTLGFSRRQFACLCFDQKVETWLHCHILAFEHFGGVPAVVVPDNLKAAVVRCAFAVDGETTLNRSYRELARYYGFLVDPTPPRSPEKKGKVESGVKYVKTNFCKPRDLDQLGIVGAQKELLRWIAEVADVRIHGTTRERPVDRFEREERAALKELPPVRFELVVWKEATVHPDSHVVFEKRLYSVPFQLIGQAVWIRAVPRSVVIYANDERVATHARCGKGYRSTDESHLPAHRAPWRQRSHDFWRERAHAVGDDVGRLVDTIFAGQDGLSKLRVVQSIVTHVASFPKERANAACRRALSFGNHTYHGIKAILQKALDLEPTAEAPKYGVLEQPRFARSPVDPVLSHRKENQPWPSPTNSSPS